MQPVAYQTRKRTKSGKQYRKHGTGVIISDVLSGSCSWKNSR